MGYCLFMIRGTLTKVSAENTDIKYARLICAGFSTACYIGPLLAFAAVILIRNLYLNSGLMLIAKLSAACAVGVVWSIYIPELSGSGMVAGVNGVLDSIGYALASISSLAFSALIGVISCRGLIAVWTALMLAASVTVVCNSRETWHSKNACRTDLILSKK